MPPANANNMKINTVLGFDIGLKRTGVAVGTAISNQAQPAGQIHGKNGQLDWSELDRLLDKWQPDVIVVGDPNTTDPHLNKLINRFKSRIQQQYKLPIIDVDEELSSAQANVELSHAQLSTSKKTQLRDQIAACLLIESFFNSTQFKSSIDGGNDDHS